MNWRLSGKALILTAIMGAFYVTDQALAKLERHELLQEAEDLHRSGEALLHDGHPADAVVKLQRAHSLQRENRDYELALAQALFDSGRKTDARTTLEDLLDVDSNDGATNLLMARLNVAEDYWQAADQYYHRAIFGSWTGSQPQDARLELAKLLADHNRNQELLSELLLLEEGMSNRPDLEKQVAALFLRAGSAGRAASIYRSLLRTDSGDADSHAGLAEAELRQGNFRGAKAEFSSALRTEPGNAALLARDQLAERLVDLDPTSRRLPESEKERRSIQLLGLTRDSIAACSGRSASPGEYQILRSIADDLLVEDKKRKTFTESSENRLDVANRLWKLRPSGCDGQPEVKELLQFLQIKVSQ